MKYRIDMRYWYNYRGYSCNPTFETFEADTIAENQAEKYVKELKENDINLLDGTDYDAVNVEIYDDEDNLISEKWVTTEYYK